MRKIFKKFRVVGVKPKKKKHPSQFTIVGKKPTVQKLPAQKSPSFDRTGKGEQKFKDLNKIRDAFGTDLDERFYIKPPTISVAKERILKYGRKVESKALERIPKIRKAAAKRVLSRKLEYGSKANVYKPGMISKNSNKAAMFPKLKIIKRTPFGKSVENKVTKLSLQAERLAKRKKERAIKRYEEKLDVIASRPKDRLKTSYKKFKPMDYREKVTNRQKTLDQGFNPDDKSSKFGNPILRKTKRFNRTPTWKFNNQFKELYKKKKK